MKGEQNQSKTSETLIYATVLLQLGEEGFEETAFHHDFTITG
jgi:hypothetical protein